MGRSEGRIALVRLLALLGAMTLAACGVVIVPLSIVCLSLSAGKRAT